MDYPTTIDQTAALRRLHQTVQSLNEAMPVKTFTRTQASGTTKTIIYRPKAINGNVKATAEHLLKAYIRQYYSTINTLGNAAFSDALPSLATNGVQIAAMRSFSDRTARNHIATLRATNIVSDYKFHGSEADFEVWINPEIIFNFPQLEVEKTKISTISAALLPPQDNNFPHKANVTHSNKVIEIDNVSNQHSDIQKSEVQLTHGNNHGDTEQPQPSSPQPPKDSDRHSNNQQGARRGGLNATTTAQKPNAKPYLKASSTVFGSTPSSYSIPRAISNRGKKN